MSTYVSQWCHYWFWLWLNVCKEITWTNDDPLTFGNIHWNLNTKIAFPKMHLRYGTHWYKEKGCSPWQTVSDSCCTYLSTYSRIYIWGPLRWFTCMDLKPFQDDFQFAVKISRDVSLLITGQTARKYRQQILYTSRIGTASNNKTL